MKKILEKLKNIKLSHIVIIALSLVILLQRCSSSCNPFHGKTVKSDTTIVHDTSFLPGKVVEIPTYVPVKGETTKPTKSIPAPSQNKDSVTAQYLDVANKYYATTSYKDSVKLKDSAYAGKDLGTVYINDQVSENGIKARDIKYQLKFPVITNTVTITNTIQEEAKRQLYVGLGLTGNQSEFVNGAQVGLIYKTKKDHIYQIQGGIQKPIGAEKLYPQVGVSTYWKIKLKK